MLCPLVATALLVIYLVSYLRRISRYPPGPLPLPLLGNLLSLNVKHPHKAIDEIGKKYGPVFTLWLPLPTVIITGLEEMKEALILKGENFSGRPSTPTDSFFMNAPNGGIIFSQGQEWKEQRTFALAVLRSFGVGSSVIEDMVHRSLDELFEHLETLDYPSLRISMRSLVALSVALATVSSDIVTVRLPPNGGGFFNGPCLSPPCGLPPPCFNPPCLPPPCLNPPCFAPPPIVLPAPQPCFNPPCFNPPPVILRPPPPPIICSSPPCFNPPPVILPPPPPPIICASPPCGPIFGPPPCLNPPCLPPPCLNPPCFAPPPMVIPAPQPCFNPPCLPPPCLSPPCFLPPPPPPIICSSPPCFAPPPVMVAPPPPVIVRQACPSPPCVVPTPPPVIVQQACASPPCLAPIPAPIVVKAAPPPCASPPCPCSGPSCSNVVAAAPQNVVTLARDDPMRDAFAAFFKQYFAAQAQQQGLARDAPTVTQQGRVASSQQVTIPLMKDGVVTNIPAQLEVIVNKKKRA